jgi:hypothetical protein
MSEEEFDSKPEEPVEEKTSLTQTILNAISDEEEITVESTPPSEETPDFSEIVKSSRGPPGGGRLIREGAPEKPASGPPTRGPPGLEEKTPSEEEKDVPTLAPILRPVLQPVARKVLTPVDDDTEESTSDEVTILKPVSRAVLKPISEASLDEEE